MTALERNIADLNARGIWVAIGTHAGYPAAVAIRETGRPTMRLGDTIPEAVSILTRDLKDCPPIPEPIWLAGTGWIIDTGTQMIHGATPERARERAMEMLAGGAM